MILINRPFTHVLACGGVVGVAVAGSLAFGSAPASLETLPASVVVALPPLPSPDSLAALLVSSPYSRRSSRGETGMLLEAVRLIEAVPWSHERADLLTEIGALPQLDSAVVTAVARSSARIASPAARARILRTLIRNHPSATGPARRSVLDAASTMVSTPERAVTLELFVTSHRLTQPALIDALTHIERLRADNERARVLVAAARSQRIDGRARTVYLRAASGIHSERYRNRVLGALRGRGGREHRP